VGSQTALLDPATGLMSPAMALEVVGLAEIAELLDVSKDSVLNYTKRADFPEPLARLAAGPVWERRKVERWADRTLPLPQGRPRKDGKRKK
jgi:hypothetical protein